MAEVSAEMAGKVADLLERNAVALIVGYEDKAAVVNGLSAWYTIRCYPDERGVTCECEAAQGGADCSHKLAAMCVWADAMLDPFSGVGA